MAQSQARKKKQAARSAAKRADRKAKKAHGAASVPADAHQVRRAFDQVGQHIQSLGQVLNSNAQVMNQGFMANDIWLETQKRIITDIYHGTVTTKLTTVEGGDGEVATIDWDHYWTLANEHITKKLQEAAEARKDNPPAPLIEREEGDELIEFGGDYANEKQEEGTGEDSHGDGCSCSEDG